VHGQLDTPFGLMVPNIEHLNVQYRLEDENNVPFMLSHVPDYVESVLTINLDELLNYKSEPDPTLESLINSYNTDHNLDIINYEERTYEEQIIDERSFEPTGETSIFDFYHKHNQHKDHSFLQSAKITA
jgi:hypothetical protein